MRSRFQSEGPGRNSETAWPLAGGLLSAESFAKKLFLSSSILLNAALPAMAQKTESEKTHAAQSEVKHPRSLDEALDNLEAPIFQTREIADNYIFQLMQQSARSTSQLKQWKVILDPDRSPDPQYKLKIESLREEMLRIFQDSVIHPECLSTPAELKTKELSVPEVLEEWRKQTGLDIQLRGEFEKKILLKFEGLHPFAALIHTLDQASPNYKVLFVNEGRSLIIETTPYPVHKKSNMNVLCQLTVYLTEASADGVRAQFQLNAFPGSEFELGEVADRKNYFSLTMWDQKVTSPISGVVVFSQFADSGKLFFVQLHPSYTWEGVMDINIHSYHLLYNDEVSKKWEAKADFTFKDIPISQTVARNPSR